MFRFIELAHLDLEAVLLLRIETEKVVYIDIVFKDVLWRFRLITRYKLIFITARQIEAELARVLHRSFLLLLLFGLAIAPDKTISRIYERLASIVNLQCLSARRLPTRGT